MLIMQQNKNLKDFFQRRAVEKKKSVFLQPKKVKI